MRGRDHGMTLVEVVVAMMILGLALGLGFRAISANRRASEAVRRQAWAMHEARSILERLNPLSYHDSALTLGTHALPEGRQYVVTVIPPGNPAARMKQVVASVPWTGGAPGTEVVPVVTLTTVFSEALHP